MTRAALYRGERDLVKGRIPIESRHRAALPPPAAPTGKKGLLPDAPEGGLETLCELVLLAEDLGELGGLFLFGGAEAGKAIACQSQSAEDKHDNCHGGTPLSLGRVRPAAGGLGRCWICHGEKGRET